MTDLPAFYVTTEHGKRAVVAYRVRSTKDATDERFPCRRNWRLALHQANARRDELNRAARKAG